MREKTTTWKKMPKKQKEFSETKKRICGEEMEINC
jgi:hypothetical protein